MVRAAPFCPMASLATWTTIGLPFSSTSSMRGMAAPGRVVVGLGDHVLDGQEAVALQAVVDERGVQAGLDVGDDPAVDVAAGQPRLGDVHLVVFQVVAMDDGDTQLFRALRVDQHLATQVRSNLRGYRDFASACGGMDGRRWVGTAACSAAYCAWIEGVPQALGLFAVSFLDSEAQEPHVHRVAFADRVLHPDEHLLASRPGSPLPGSGRSRCRPAQPLR